MAYSPMDDYGRDLEDGAGRRSINNNAPGSNRKRSVIAILVLIGIAAAVAIAAYVYTTDSGSSGSDFQKSIKVENIQGHLRELWKVAQANGGSRAVATGYNASAEYVESVLARECPNYTVRRQHFVVPIHTELEKPQLSVVTAGGQTVRLTHATDFQGLRYGGDGEHTVTEQAIRVLNYGCESADWEPVRAVASAIALVTYGGPCHTFDKALIAEGIPSVKLTMIHRSEAEQHLAMPIQRSFKLAWTDGDPIIYKPLLTITYSTAQLLALPNHQTTAYVKNEVKLHTTFNIIAESTYTGSRRDRTIIQGSHLDGVPEGPGINDNGSGTSVNLELTIRFCKHIKKPRNHFRAIWYGAEEIGLLGSYHYVSQLSQAERDEIAIAINYDMLGSPNGVRGVHNGTESPPGTPEDVIKKSNHLTGIFTGFFDKHDQPWNSAPMLAGSDFLPYLQANIPAGGIATGASGIVTMEERDKHSILANAANDPCYHLPCDTFPNIGTEIIRDVAQAAAHVLENLTMDRQLFQ